MLEKWPEKNALKITQNIVAHTLFVEQAVDSTTILSPHEIMKKRQFEYDRHFDDKWIEFSEESPEETEERGSISISDSEDENEELQKE